MKKLVISVILLTICAPIFAQQTFYEGFFTPSTGSIFKTISHAVSSMLPEEKAPWVSAVQKEENRANRNGVLGASFYGIPARSFKQESPTQDIGVYQQRLFAFNSLLKNHSVLSRYKFQVPHPSDLTSLSAVQLRFLENFFIQPTFKESFDSRYTPLISHPEAAETQLSFLVEGKQLILLINSRPDERIVYFFLNNAPQAPKKTTNHAHHLMEHGRVANGHVVPSF